MDIFEAKEKVLFWSKKAYSQNLFAGTSGNLSIYIPEQDAVVITPTSVRYETMTLEDIVVTNLAGEVLEGKHKPSSENRLHRAIFAAGLAKSVVHTHSPYATSFAVNNSPIPLILIEMIPFLGGEVPCVPVEMPGTDQLAESIVKGISGKNACLMGNHGVVAIADDIEKAYLRAEYVEDAAKICKLAMIGGETFKVPEAMEKEMKLRMEQRKKHA
ncbi:MAG: class II aldolase/adducin family protein [Anaerolineaceae bacterium]|nr:class II aldolase/adducin family protein [Anaerolineaceae bacterium]